MFQFTREFIINDNEGKLNGAKFVGAGGMLKVDHMINIKAADVCSAYKSEGEDAVEEELKLDFDKISGLTADKLYRLVFVCEQEGRVISTYNDQYPDHSRSFFYEAVAKGADANTLKSNLADDLAAAIEEEIKRFESPFFTVEHTAGAKVINLKALEGDCYTRFVEVRLVEVPLDRPSIVGAALTGYLDYTVLAAEDRKQILVGSGLASLVHEGNTGKNTTNYIIHNMRLLTSANITPYGVNMDERPLPKSVYDQYTFELVTERRHIGHQVMGAVDKSLVTVIFFVLHSIASEFETALENAGIAVEAVAQPQPVKKIIATTKDVEDAASAVLPSTEGASAGQVLKLDANKDPKWDTDATA